MENKIEELEGRIRQVEIDMMKVWKFHLRFGQRLEVLERKVNKK